MKTAVAVGWSLWRLLDPSVARRKRVKRMGDPKECVVEKPASGTYVCMVLLWLLDCGVSFRHDHLQHAM